MLFVIVNVSILLLTLIVWRRIWFHENIPKILLLLFEKIKKCPTRYSSIYALYLFCFLQEYSLIMSERDSVHKEIEKFQEEIKEKNKKLAAQDGRHKHHEDEVNRVSLNHDLNFRLGIWYIYRTCAIITPLLNNNHTCTYMRTEFSEKPSLKTKKWSS